MLLYPCSIAAGRAAASSTGAWCVRWAGAGAQASSKPRREQQQRPGATRGSRGRTREQCSRRGHGRIRRRQQVREVAAAEGAAASSRTEQQAAVVTAGGHDGCSVQGERGWRGHARADERGLGRGRRGVQGVGGRGDDIDGCARNRAPATVTNDDE